MAEAGGNRDQRTATGSMGAAGASAIKPQPMMQQGGAAEAGAVVVPASWQGAEACACSSEGVCVLAA
uniref:Uncharacterized protein n=1 Tax=Bosea sp. NBC_00436 TaxID=2969620 RepID=A0A9E7ZFQ3_9HYPH